MEALSISITPSRIHETSTAHRSSGYSPYIAPALRASVSRNRPLRLSRREPSSWRSGNTVRALDHGVFGDRGDDDAELGNGVGLILDEGSSWFESNLNHNGNHVSDITKASDIVTPATVGNGTSLSSSGLFRTPISGGVQSATSAHDLPRPALAVRNLMQQARFAHLCTIMSRNYHRREGYPSGSLVDFAADSMGHPIFSFSPLAIHTQNLLADSRCTLVVQAPGWSGLSNARVTIFGDTVLLPAEQQEWARKQYVSKHQQWTSQQWGNFYYFRMQNIRDVYFIGGFGTVAWLDVKEYEAQQPDKITVDGVEQNLKELNAIFSKPLKEFLSTEMEIDDAAFISVDSKGTDIRVRNGAQLNIQRLSFEVENGVQTLEEAMEALRRIISRGR